MTKEEYSKTLDQCLALDYTLIWTQKESYGKYTGLGICYEMDKWSAWGLNESEEYQIQSYIFKDYVISVTSMEKMDLRYLSFNEMMSYCSQFD